VELNAVILIAEIQFTFICTVMAIFITVLVIVQLPEGGNQEKSDDDSLGDLGAGDTGLTLCQDPGTVHQLGKLNGKWSSV